MYDIRHLGEDVYLVDGKVMWIQEHAIDATTQDGKTWLCEHAGFMRISKFRFNPYGDLTADLIYPKSASIDGDAYPIEPIHFGDLPEAVKPALRIAFSQYANDI